MVEKDIVKETVKDGKSNKVLDATLEDLEGSRIHCTLWDDFAVKMQQSLDSHDSSLPVVVVFQLCRLKKYFENAEVNWIKIKMEPLQHHPFAFLTFLFDPN